MNFVCNLHKKNMNFILIYYQENPTSHLGEKFSTLTRKERIIAFSHNKIQNLNFYFRRELIEKMLFWDGYLGGLNMVTL